MRTMPTEPPLTVEQIHPALTTHVFGQIVEAYAIVGSTNDLLRAAAEAGLPEGMLIVADEQATGRGRRGRLWQAPPGGAILASLLLRPRTPLSEMFAPIMLLALAVLRTVQALGVPAGLKWPNDVLVGRRKLAGVLAESAVSNGRINFVVVGFGVNVGFDPAAVGLGDIATSLSVELGGQAPGRAVVLARILAEAERRYSLWQAGGYTALWAEWRDALTTLGGFVRVEVGTGEIVSGQALRVDPDGALRVATPDGEEQRVVAGTVLL